MDLTVIYTGYLSYSSERYSRERRHGGGSLARVYQMMPRYHGNLMYLTQGMLGLLLHAHQDNSSVDGDCPKGLEGCCPMTGEAECEEITQATLRTWHMSGRHLMDRKTTILGARMMECIYSVEGIKAVSRGY